MRQPPLTRQRSIVVHQNTLSNGWAHAISTLLSIFYVVAYVVDNAGENVRKGTNCTYMPEIFLAQAATSVVLLVFFLLFASVFRKRGQSASFRKCRHSLWQSWSSSRSCLHPMDYCDYAFRFAWPYDLVSSRFLSHHWRMLGIHQERRKSYIEDCILHQRDIVTHPPLLYWSSLHVWLPRCLLFCHSTGKFRHQSVDSTSILNCSFKRWTSFIDDDHIQYGKTNNIIEDSRLRC